MQSIFGFYYIAGLLSHMGWPRRRSLFNSEAVVNCLILDLTIEQMIDWAASIGACRPNLGLRIIASMFRDMDWASEVALDINAEIIKHKKQWNEKGIGNNPNEAVKPVKLASHSKVMSMKQLKDKDFKYAMEVYCYESLCWGLVNSDSFKTYFSLREKRQNERMNLYKKAGLEIDNIPSLEQYTNEGEEILKGYEKEVRPLSPIPQKLLSDALSIGIRV
jgi:hypothetical protein